MLKKNLNEYNQLSKLLAAKQWQKADLATREIMLFITEADKRKDLLMTQKDLKQFPCYHLRFIDQLWLKYSHGKFGFSIILTIYNEVDRDYARLAERVGWRVGDKWIGYKDIDFSDNAPKGHLPLTWLVPTTFSMYWLARFASAGWRLILNRANSCQLLSKFPQMK